MSDDLQPTTTSTTGDADAFSVPALYVTAETTADDSQSITTPTTGDADAFSVPALYVTAETTADDSQAPTPSTSSISGVDGIRVSVAQAIEAVQELRDCEYKLGRDYFESEGYETVILPIDTSPVSGAPIAEFDHFQPLISFENSLNDGLDLVALLPEDTAITTHVDSSVPSCGYYDTVDATI